MPMRTTIVFSGDVVNAIDDDHTIKIRSHGFRMNNRTAVLRMHKSSDRASAAAAHGPETQDRMSAVVLHCFGAEEDVPDGRNRTTTSQHLDKWCSRSTTDLTPAFVRAMWLSVRKCK